MIEPHIHSVHNFPLHTHSLTLPPNPEHNLGPTVNMFLHNFSGLQRHYHRHRNDGQDVRWCEHRHRQLGGRGGGHGDGDGRGVPAVKEREVTTTKDPATTPLTLTIGRRDGQRHSRRHSHSHTHAHVHTHTHTPTAPYQYTTATVQPYSLETGRGNRDNLIDREERRIRSHDNIQSQGYHDKLGSSPHKSREKTVRTSWQRMKVIQTISFFSFLFLQ